MALTPSAIGASRAKWRGLAQLAVDVCTPGPIPQDFDRLKRDANEAMNWPTPLPGYHDAFVLFALARLAAAFAKCPVAELRKRAPSLVALAHLVLEMLGEEPEPQRLPYRADIDG